MLTKKGKYGLKALIALARLPEGKTAFSAEIASENQIPKKFLDTILVELRNAGILRSRKGPAGGYSLLLPASEIRIGRAIRIIDGPLAPIRCASRTAYEGCDDCPEPSTCLVRRAMTEVRDAISDILDRLTLEQMTQADWVEGDWLSGEWTMSGRPGKLPLPGADMLEKSSAEKLTESR
jgi:Rrf2 family protein